MDFFRVLEDGLGNALRTEQEIVSEGPWRDAIRRMEHHFAALMVIGSLAYLEEVLGLGNRRTVDQLGYREEEFKVLRAIRNAVTHCGGNLDNVERPRAARRIVEEFLTRLRAGQVLSPTNESRTVAPYFDLDADGVVRMNHRVFFHLRSLSLHLLAEQGNVE